MIITPVSTSALVVTYTATAAPFGATLVAGRFYEFVATTTCWIKQGTAPVAVANTAGNILVPLGKTVYLDGAVGVDVSVVRDAADGKATLTGVKTY